MSKPRTVLVTDPLIDASDKILYPIIQGGAEVNQRRFNSTAYDNSSTHFSVPPPNPGTFISRKFTLKMRIRLVFKMIDVAGGNPAVGRPWSQNAQSFRQFPLASIMKNLSVTINGCVITLPVSDVIKPLIQYNNRNENSDWKAHTGPSHHDLSQDYMYTIGPAGVNFQTNNLYNPMNDITSANAKNRKGNGAIEYVTFDHDPALGAGNVYSPSISADISEQLFISPLVFGCSEEYGLVNVNSLDVHIDWEPEAFKCWSNTPYKIDAGNVVYQFTGFEHHLNDIVPEIMFEYITPPQGYRIPQQVQYPYNEINRYITPTRLRLAVNATFTSVFSNNIQLSVIPKYIYICVRRSKRSLDNLNLDRRQGILMSQPDSYAKITNLRMNWNNQSTLFTNATTEQLYEISRRNGYIHDFTGFSGSKMIVNGGDITANIRRLTGIGSVLCFEVGKNIPLDPGEAPGCPCMKSLQIQIDGTWLSSNFTEAGLAGVSPDLELVIITQTPGILSVDRSGAYKKIAVINEVDVKSAKKDIMFDWEDSKQDLLSGGKNYHKANRKARY